MAGVDVACVEPVDVEVCWFGVSFFEGDFAPVVLACVLFRRAGVFKHGLQHCRAVGEDVFVGVEDEG